LPYQPSLRRRARQRAARLLRLPARCRWLPQLARRATPGVALLVDAVDARPGIRRAVAEIARAHRHPGADREEPLSRAAQAGARLPAAVADRVVDRGLPRRRRLHAAALRAEQPPEQQRLFPALRMGPHL